MTNLFPLLKIKNNFLVIQPKLNGLSFHLRIDTWNT